MPRGAVNINFNVHVTASSVREFLGMLHLLEQHETLVGVPEEKAPRDGEATNALIAYVQNYGYPPMNIPARPFMETGIKDKQEVIVNDLRRGAIEVLNGGDPRRSLQAAGVHAVSGIKSRITSNIPPPLKPGTLASRRRRGVQRTGTLRDTGKMINSITSVVRRRS